ncbi:hypothetical protein WN48_01164 [Eufriesea mexicana]|nr:hypothetical protein WN48_01164 [Eufriesea mexicana]
MKKHICSSCTIVLANTRTWNIRSPGKSSFAKMFLDLPAEQVKRDPRETLSVAFPRAHVSIGTRVPRRRRDIIELSSDEIKQALAASYANVARKTRSALRRIVARCTTDSERRKTGTTRIVLYASSISFDTTDEQTVSPN